MSFTFGTFMEHAAARFEALKGEYLQWAALPPLSESHVFWLGDDEDFNKHVQSVFEDVASEINEKIPMPFSDVSMVSVIKYFGLGEVWTLDRLFENPAFLAELVPGGDTSPITAEQKFLIVRYQVNLLLPELAHKPEPILTWMVGYLGVDGQTMSVEIAPDITLLKLAGKKLPHQQLLGETKVIFFQTAAISHPANYIVQVTPELTPKEERKVAAGKPRPGQKPVHFIVVDHTVLVRMRAEGGGTHASPVPHERRGHWRRLSERCRHAKLLGRDRILVRPAIVGDFVWKGQRNVYEVLPYLNAPKVVSA
jgi:hypothetical protein